MFRSVFSLQKSLPVLGYVHAAVVGVMLQIVPHDSRQSVHRPGGDPAPTSARQRSSAIAVLPGPQLPSDLLHPLVGEGELLSEQRQGYCQHHHG